MAVTRAKISYNSSMDMTKKEIVETLLSASQGQSSTVTSAGGGAGWLGQVSGVQQEVNAELQKWKATRDDATLYSIIELLETVSALSDAEASRLRVALDKLNS